jgi:thioredoxin-related protein
VTRTYFGLVLVLAALPFVGGTSAAQEVKWRHDYAAARKEATETGRPLLFDFGTEACFWCKKLDATTFRDPKVVKLLNEQFIPVKIDANKHPRLTETLKVDSYPTLILATADGKVVGRHVGYAEVSQMMGLLNKAPAPPTPVPARASAPPTPVVQKPCTKEELDAGLAALFPEIAAALDK